MSAVNAVLIRQIIGRILPAIIGLIIIAGFVMKMGPATISQTIISVNPLLLLISTLILAGAMIIKSYRWHLLLIPAGIRDLRLAMFSYFSGQITNELLPTGSGEVARIAIIKRQKSIKFMGLVPAILLERLYDITLLLVLSVFLAAIFINRIILVFLIIVIVFVALLFVKPSAIELLAEKFKSWASKFNKISHLSSFAADKAIEMSESIDFYGKNKMVLIVNLFLTLIAWVGFEALSQYILLEGFGVHITLLNLLGVVSISWVLGTVSMLPGGLGAREVVYAWALLGVSAGISFETAFSIAMLYRALVYILFAISVIVTYLTNKSSAEHLVQKPA